MFTSLIKFRNFKDAKQNKKVEKNLKFILNQKNQVLKSLSKLYKDNHKARLIKNFSKKLDYRIIGMGGSILGAQAIYDFLKNKIKSNLNSVNTIKYDNLEIKHYNTDISGFKKFYEFHVEPDHSDLNKFLIFGGGGASISICKSLLDLRKEVIIVNRTNINDKWPKSLISQVKHYTLDNYESNKNIDVYINATTLGLSLIHI